jgi:membrane-bound lytic murein transglycosylase D
MLRPGLSVLFKKSPMAVSHALLACSLLALAALLPAYADAAPARTWFDGKRYPIVTGPEFPADEFILDQAKFWFEIYYLVEEDEGLLHDPFHPYLVLRKVKVPPTPGRASSKAIDAVLDRLRGELREAAAKDSASRTPMERELMAMLPSHWDSIHVELCASRLRFQRGLRNKFRAGVERSYRYLPLIDSVFRARGLPERLKYLPHVESSFYPHAYSKVGAAGMWQFMKSSARQFRMKVGYHVDERRDPIASTRAAAAMLGSNHAKLDSWPLALVAYNHGPGGMARAVRETGTRDLSTIIKSYYSNTFGFASKNFYAEFLAASSIAMKADSLYPGLAKLEPLRFRSLPLPKPVRTRLLCDITGLSASGLEEYNLELRPASFRGNAVLPKGHVIHLPVDLDVVAIASRLGMSGTALAALKAKYGDAAAVAVGSVSAEAAGGEIAGTAVAMASPAPADKVEAPTSEAVPSESDAGTGGAPGRTAPESPVAAAGSPSLGASDEGSGTLPGAASASRPARPKEEARAIAAAKPQAELRPGRPASAAPSRPAPQEPSALALAEPRPKKPQGGQAAALAKAEGPAARAGAPAAAATATAAALVEAERSGPVVDSTFALQVAGLDRLAHPMDRFNPAIYNLEHERKDGHLVIRVGAEETLSHYAEWAMISEGVLRRLNRIRGSRDFRIGRSIRIPIPEDRAREFLAKREEYYRAMEEDFYGSYYVSQTEPLVVAKGKNLWGVMLEKEIPFWLLQKHNPGKTLGEVRPGDTLHLPLIENGIRKWGFTRYGNSREFLSGIGRYIVPD